MTALDERAVLGLRSFVSEPGPGDVLGQRFELREPIGEGGMGVVFAAWDRESGREVAVKIVRAMDEQSEKRFDREAAALEAVAHPAIVRYLAQGAHGSVRYYAMDRLVGCTLADRLRAGRLNVSDAVGLAIRMAGGLTAVHRAGLVHRDVKPSNIFLVDGNVADPHLLDFGLARKPRGVAVTERRALVGTPGYMAPEQVRGDASIGARADVFALGCVLFECLTGRPLFRSDTETILARTLLEAPPRTRDLAGEVPLALEGLVEQMLEKRESMRPDANEVVRELTALQALLPTAPVDGAVPIEVAPGSLNGLVEGAVIAGKYRVERRIGEGGMGIVLLATHVELGKRVAIKLLREGEGSSVTRFVREARAAARLESEHVARVLDVGKMVSRGQGSPYIVMEYLSGKDFARHLLEDGPVPVRVAVGYILEACEAIAEAHTLGIVHRDIKPSNIFLVTRRDGSRLVKVLDFGISKFTQRAGLPREESFAGVSMTGASAVLGSVAYMSPEQLRNAKEVDARTDIWAMGVVLHELITGTRPFEGESPAALGARIASAEPTRLRLAMRDAPPELEAVLLRCLEKDPSARFPDVRALARALAPFASTAVPPARFEKRWIGAVAGAALAAVALVAVVVGLTRKAETTSPSAAPTEALPSLVSSAPAVVVAAVLPSPPAPTAEVIPSATVPSASLATPPRPPGAPAPRRPATSKAAPSAATSSHGPADLDLRDPALERR